MGKSKLSGSGSLYINNARKAKYLAYEDTIPPSRFVQFTGRKTDQLINIGGREASSSIDQVITNNGILVIASNAGDYSSEWVLNTFKITKDSVVGVSRIVVTGIGQSYGLPYGVSLCKCGNNGFVLSIQDYADRNNTTYSDRVWGMQYYEVDNEGNPTLKSQNDNLNQYYSTPWAYVCDTYVPGRILVTTNVSANTLNPVAIFYDVTASGFVKVGEVAGISSTNFRFMGGNRMLDFNKIYNLSCDDTSRLSITLEKTISSMGKYVGYGHSYASNFEDENTIQFIVDTDNGAYTQKIAFMESWFENGEWHDGPVLQTSFGAYGSVAIAAVDRDVCSFVLGAGYGSPHPYPNSGFGLVYKKNHEFFNPQNLNIGASSGQTGSDGNMLKIDNNRVSFVSGGTSFGPYVGCSGYATQVDDVIKPYVDAINGVTVSSCSETKRGTVLVPIG